MTDSWPSGAATAFLAKSAARCEAVSRLAPMLANLSRAASPALLPPAQEGEEVRKTSAAGMDLPSLTTPRWGPVADAAASCAAAPRSPSPVPTVPIRVPSNVTPSPVPVVPILVPCNVTPSPPPVVPTLTPCVTPSPVPVVPILVPYNVTPSPPPVVPTLTPCNVTWLPSPAPPGLLPSNVTWPSPPPVVPILVPCNVTWLDRKSVV